MSEPTVIFRSVITIQNASCQSSLWINVMNLHRYGYLQLFARHSKKPQPRKEKKKVSRLASCVSRLVIYIKTMSGCCWSLCFLLSAVAGATRGWDLGRGLKYEITTTLLFREAGRPRPGGDVGFQMTGYLKVVPVWQDPKNLNTVILKIKVFVHCYTNKKKVSLI